MKVLLIGSSSDIAQYMIKNASNEHDFIELTSNPSGSHQHEINVQDESTFPSIEGKIDGLVYFPGSINLRPFSGLKLSDFQTDYEINVLGLIKILKHFHKQLAQNSSLVFISTVAAQV